MPEQNRYALPVKAGEQRLLGQLTCAAYAVECADIIERHDGLVVLMAPDMQNSLRLRDELQLFIAHLITHAVSTLSDWDALSYDIDL
ncbi:MAG: hypothetical protein ACSLEM_03340 [Candidatus Malihini olakiniferum]